MSTVINYQFQARFKSPQNDVHTKISCDQWMSRSNEWVKLEMRDMFLKFQTICSKCGKRCKHLWITLQSWIRQDLGQNIWLWHICTVPVTDLDTLSHSSAWGRCVQTFDYYYYYNYYCIIAHKTFKWHLKTF